MSNYRKGRRFEYTILYLLRDNGLIAGRMGQSKPWDITAFSEKCAYAVECKCSALSHSQIDSAFEKLVSDISIDNRISAANPLLFYKPERGVYRMYTEGPARAIDGMLYLASYDEEEKNFKEIGPFQTKEAAHA